MLIFAVMSCLGTPLRRTEVAALLLVAAAAAAVSALAVPEPPSDASAVAGSIRGEPQASGFGARSLRDVLAGTALSLGLYHLALFAMRPKERAALYFAFCCLVIFVQHGLVGPAPDLTGASPAFGVFLRVHSGLRVLALAALLEFVREMFPRDVDRRPARALQAILVACALAAWAGRLLLFDARLPFALTGFSVLFWALVAARRRRRGALIFVAGMILMIALHAVNRFLYGGSPEDAGLPQLGQLAFLLSQALLLFRRFSDSMTEVERLSEERGTMVERLLEERRQRERWQELSVAASGLAHETKNPLGIIRGLAQRLRAAPELSGPDRERTEHIVDEADRAASRLDDFLSYARIREPRPEPVDLREVVERVLSALETDVEAAGVEVAVEVTAVSPPAGDPAAEPGDAGSAVVRADREMLIEIVLNLLLNGLDASLPGTTITVGCEALGGEALGGEARNGRGRLWVEDQGHGIEAGRLEEVRKPYVSFKPDGHGLGLAIVSRFVERSGWTLAIRSEPGRGTRVEIDGLEIIGVEPGSTS